MPEVIVAVVVSYMVTMWPPMPAAETTGHPVPAR
jgi:hypothetical protein